MTGFDRRTVLSMVPPLAIARPSSIGGNAKSFGLPATFNEISSHFIHPATDRLNTFGYLNPGDGGHAAYVSDDLATAQLADLAPFFCKVSADGRHWRAATTSDGLVPVAAGGAVGASSAESSRLRNTQPIIAQALAYNLSIGVSGLQFNDGHYDIFCPLRLAEDNDLRSDRSGIPFLITGPTIWCSGPNGTVFHRRKFDGSDPAIFKGTQYLRLNTARNGLGIYWRGGMFFLVGLPDPRPKYETLPSLTLKGTWKISGGIPQSQPPQGLILNGATPYYVLNSQGGGWDITDKPICAAGGHTGDIIFDGAISIGGFRGELLYQADQTNGSIYQAGTLLMHDTDGDGFCPGPSFSNNTSDGYGTVQMESLTIMNAFQGVEGATGWNGKILHLNVINCVMGGGLMAGIWGPQEQPVNRPPPVLTLHRVHVSNCYQYTFYRGNVCDLVESTDTKLCIGQGEYSTTGVIINEAVITADRYSIDGIIFFSTSEKGSCGTTNNLIGTVNVRRTISAEAAGRLVFNAVDWFGSLGSSNVINKVTGLARVAPCSENPSSVTDNAPQINIVELTYA